MAQFPHSKLHRRPWETGLTPFLRATTYARIADGTFPPPVKIGRMSVWPARELVAVNEALIQGGQMTRSGSSCGTWSVGARQEPGHEQTNEGRYRA